MNVGLFSKARLSIPLSKAYAQTLHNYTQQHRELNFDVLFGPAYKGIQLSATTAAELFRLDESKWQDIGSSFNRKEAKDHGEGGTIVGESLKGKRVVVIDDVMTSGKAIREAMSIIDKQGGKLVGIIVALDRQEKMPSESEKEGKGDDGSARGSAIGEVRRESGVPVLAVLTLKDLIAGMKAKGRNDDVEAMQKYYKQYGATD